MPSPLAVSPSNTTNPPSTSPMSFTMPPHPLSFENMLRQFRKSSYPLLHLESGCIPRSANSQPSSPPACLGAPFLPVMSNDLDISIPPYHRSYNDSQLNLSPTSSGSSDGLSCEFPVSRFEQFRNTRSRVLLVSVFILRAFQCLTNRLKLQKDHRWPLPSFVSFFTEVSATPIDRRNTC